MVLNVHPANQCATSSAGSGISGIPAIRGAICVHPMSVDQRTAFCSQPPFLQTHPRKKTCFKKRICRWYMWLWNLSREYPRKNHKMVGLILLISPFLLMNIAIVTRKKLFGWPSSLLLKNPESHWKVTIFLGQTPFNYLVAREIPSNHSFCCWNPVKSPCLLVESHGKITKIFMVKWSSNHRFCWWNHFWIHGLWDAMGQNWVPR